MAPLLTFDPSSKDRDKSFAFEDEDDFNEDLVGLNGLDCWPLPSSSLIEYFVLKDDDDFDEDFDSLNSLNFWPPSATSSVVIDRVFKIRMSMTDMRSDVTTTLLFQVCFMMVVSAILDI